MNLFMRRDDDALRTILPGLMDPEEVARRYRWANIVNRSREAELITMFSNAKRAFRSLKAVLNNNIATQFFKAFCLKRGRSSLNSFFFLMDVSWLHQTEAGDHNDRDDFLSAMFSDSVSVTPSLVFSSADKSGQSPDPMLCSTESTDRPHHSHFAKNGLSRSSSVCSDTSPVSLSTPSSPSTATPPTAQIIEEETKNVSKSPRMPVVKGSPGSMSPGKTTNAPMFSSMVSDAIAHFIHESYFGRKSLAQRDLRHAALLGCSQIPDYINLRDHDNIIFSPVMFDNLVVAVTKKFTSEVIPQFLNSISFQVMVYALMITGFFDDQQHDQTNKSPEKDSEQMPSFKADDLIKGLWPACISTSNPKVKKDKDESSSSSSSSSDSDSDDSDSDAENNKDVPEDQDK